MPEMPGVRWLFLDAEKLVRIVKDELLALALGNASASMQSPTDLVLEHCSFQSFRFSSVSLGETGLKAASASSEKTAIIEANAH